jgi:hypothetical protein
VLGFRGFLDFDCEANLSSLYYTELPRRISSANLLYFFFFFFFFWLNIDDFIKIQRDKPDCSQAIRSRIQVGGYETHSLSIFCLVPSLASTCAGPLFSL